MMNEMKELTLEQANEIAENSEPTHVRFTYADNSFHEYPIGELADAIETLKWHRLNLRYGVKLNEKHKIKNKGIASGWRIDDFIQIGESDWSWNSEQVMSPAWEYHRRS